MSLMQINLTPIINRNLEPVAICDQFKGIRKFSVQSNEKLQRLLESQLNSNND